MSASSKRIDLRVLLGKKLGVAREAANCMIAHGQVSIDGHTVQPQWVCHWTQDQLYGRMLKCPRGEFRIIGSRLMRDHEQMRLG